MGGAMCWGYDSMTTSDAPSGLSPAFHQWKVELYKETETSKCWGQAYGNFFLTNHQVDYDVNFTWFTWLSLHQRLVSNDTRDQHFVS